MLCFHGYGMHGKQFKVLTEKFGKEYTFFGFDLFFHKETKLIDDSILFLKQGIAKPVFCDLILDFCKSQNINRFSVMSYSLGTYYASALAETCAEKIDLLFLIAPAFLKPFPPFKIMARNYFANLAFRKLFLSRKGIDIALKMARKAGLIDDKSYGILLKEMGTPELRYAFYANVTFMRYLELNENTFVNALNENNVKCFFIFGERDRMFPPHLADYLIAQLKLVEKTVLNEDHDMINLRFAANIEHLIYDN